MLFLVLALQTAMTMDMSMPGHSVPADSRRVESTADRVVMPEPPHPNKLFIPMDDLAKSTIAYCQRTGRTFCSNYVSSLSGGAKVEVCKVKTKWLVNKCVKYRP